MDIVKIIISVLLILVSIAISVVVLMQEGKQAGLGTISGAADTYWGKNKGRSIEGKLEKATTVFAVLFFVFSIVLNLKWLN